jgi:hypothetical protein
MLNAVLFPCYECSLHNTRGALLFFASQRMRHQGRAVYCRPSRDGSSQASTSGASEIGPAHSRQEINSVRAPLTAITASRNHSGMFSFVQVHPTYSKMLHLCGSLKAELPSNMSSMGLDGFRADFQPGCYFPQSQSPSKQLEDFQLSRRKPPRKESLPSASV